MIELNLMNYFCFLESDVDIADSMKKIIEVFLKDLPKCVNRDLTDKVSDSASTEIILDSTVICVVLSVLFYHTCCFIISVVLMCFQAALDFLLNMNTKFNRRKLVRALFTVQRTR